jgi:predicted 3-demethylubiquinone-9 3-methyltransferase (glyoxalase superfamily)
MQKIVPFLWFDGKAEEAANFYASIFKNSKIDRITRYGEAGPGPKGTVMSVIFQLEGQEFYALNGGPQFTFTPAISFFVNCAIQEEINELFKKLSDGGKILMPLDDYPFSERFGWVEDKFGVSWQLNLAGRAQKITPFLMFAGKQSGKAEEAMNFYVSLFSNSSIEKIERYNEGEESEESAEGTVMHAIFSLNGQEFMALDSNIEHPFTFTEAISLFVNCETQAEVDQLWEKLSKVGENQGPGWMKDKYGVSWQIVPTVLGELLNDHDPEKSKRVMNAMLQMGKIDIEKLKQAYEG